MFNITDARCNHDVHLTNLTVVFRNFTKARTASVGIFCGRNQFVVFVNANYLVVLR